MEFDFFDNIEETEDLTRVRLALQNGWTILDIYKPRREVEYSNGVFEEYAVYIIAKPRDASVAGGLGGSGGKIAKLQERAVSSAVTEIQKAVLNHEKTLTAESEAEQSQFSEAAKHSMIEALKWLDCLE